MKQRYAKLWGRRLAFSLLATLTVAFLVGCGGDGGPPEQEQTRCEGGQSSMEGTAAQGGDTTAASSTEGANDATAEVIAATEAFLATLDDAQREQVTFDFDDPLKCNWSNFPVQMVARNGVTLGDMTEEQQQAAMAVLEAALSEEGYQKTVGNMVSDQVLAAEEGDSEMFGADLYYFAIFGTPSETEPWMLQYGGHHYALNLTISGEDNVLTPSLTGVQPSEYTLAEAGELPAFVPADVLGSGTIRPMGDENDLAFELINALDTQQQEQAILDYDVSALVLGPDQNVRALEPEGIPVSEMNADQQTLLLDIVREWAGIVDERAAEARMSEIEDNLDETYFAWSGPTTNGEPIYYRMTGPTLHIEFNHEEEDVLHIHSIYRDPTNDYSAQSVAE
ncbi:MAG: DUF3500 domain-containing protein [Rubrobacter sp.]